MSFAPEDYAGLLKEFARLADKKYKAFHESLLPGTETAYGVQMAAAWAVSVCFVKFPEHTLPLLRRRTLPKFTQNKSIQKIRESRRVDGKAKETLLPLKL